MGAIPRPYTPCLSSRPWIPETLEVGGGKAREACLDTLRASRQALFFLPVGLLRAWASPWELDCVTAIGKGWGLKAALLSHPLLLASAV